MPAIHVRVDANNLWPDSETAVKYLRALNYPLSAIEEPLRSKNIEQLREVSNQLDMPIILDESFLRENQFEVLEPDPEHWIINLRISKMGGLLRSLDIVERARARHIPLIVGAQVGETSLLTRAAITIMHVARDICVAREGAFGTRLLTHDICDIPLMFGQSGILDTDSYLYFRNDGLGIPISDMARPFLKAIKN